MEVPKKLWEIKQSTKPNTIDLYIYGDVEGDSYDWWEDRTIVSETSANHFRDELAKYPDVSNINIYINSYGGSVFEGTAIYNQLRRHSAYKTVYIDGFACSVASVIAMAGDKVIMPANTMMMIHNAWNCVWGNAKELRKAADDLDTIMEGNRQAYLQKAGDKLQEEVLIDLLEKESWLTAKQCLEYGLCDEIAEQEVDMTEAQQLLQKANRTMEQKLTYNQAIAARLKEMVETPKEPSQPTPPAEPIKQENKPLKMLKALANK